MNLLWDDSRPRYRRRSRPRRRGSTGQAGFGNAVALNGAHPNRSVTMPAGIVSGLCDFTVATWVNLGRGAELVPRVRLRSGPDPTCS